MKREFVVKKSSPPPWCLDKPNVRNLIVDDETVALFRMEYELQRNKLSSVEHSIKNALLKISELSDVKLAEFANARGRLEEMIRNSDVPRSIIRERLQNGWDLQEAITLPKGALRLRKA